MSELEEDQSLLDGEMGLPYNNVWQHLSHGPHGRVSKTALIFKGKSCKHYVFIYLFIVFISPQGCNSSTCILFTLHIAETWWHHTSNCNECLTFKKLPFPSCLSRNRSLQCPLGKGCVTTSPSQTAPWFSLMVCVCVCWGVGVCVCATLC